MLGLLCLRRCGLGRGALHLPAAQMQAFLLEEVKVFSGADKVKAKLYRVIHREGEEEKYIVAAESAQEACEKVRLPIGNCLVREIVSGIWRTE